MEEPIVIMTGVIAILYRDEDHVVKVFLKPASLSSGDVKSVEMTVNLQIKDHPIKCPYILEHCCMNEEDGVLVFPRCWHGDLVNYLDECRPSFELRFTWMKQMVEAVYFMHTELQLAHMDLSPENFMVAEDLTLKLGDFAQACSANHPLLIRTTVGKKVYRPYEVLDATEVEDPKACDMWSLGICIFTIFYNYFLWSTQECFNFRTFVKHPSVFWKTVATWIPDSRNHVFILSLVKELVCIDVKKRMTIGDLRTRVNAYVPETSCLPRAEPL